MLTTRIVSKAIEDVAKIMEVEAVLNDKDGKITVRTPLIDEEEVKSEECLYLSLTLGKDEEEEYELRVRGEEENSKKAILLLSSQLKSLDQAYKKKVDHHQFFQDLLLDNLLLVDIHNKAKILRLEEEQKRIVFLVETQGEQDNISMEMLRSLFLQQKGDYVTSVDRRYLVVIKGIKENEGEDSFCRLAETIVDMMNTEALMQVRVAYGTPADTLREVSRSYKEAKIALEVGEIFTAKKRVVSFSKLGIGRLIYQLPVNLCAMFMEEILGKDFELSKEEDLLTTVQMFFQQNLNLSETARQLYIHRNTLVYRLERLEKETGLDVRKFEDALTFCLALMVYDYLAYVKKKER